MNIEKNVLVGMEGPIYIRISQRSESIRAHRLSMS